VAVLVIAGSDSSGGAGMQRDLQVTAELGEDALAVVTAVTAQSAARVHHVHRVPEEAVAAQLDASLAAPQLLSIKIGMLGTEAIALLVSDRLAHTTLPIVLDPVLASSSGSALIDAGGQKLLLDKLAPKATLVTPNLPEVALLLGAREATSQEEARSQALEFQQLVGCAVLLKGGHLPGPHATDHLVCEGEVTVITSPRVQNSMRGTGCALSTAIAVYLGQGKSLVQATRLAKEVVTDKIRRASR